MAELRLGGGAGGWGAWAEEEDPHHEPGAPGSVPLLQAVPLFPSAVLRAKGFFSLLIPLSHGDIHVLAIRCPRPRRRKCWPSGPAV